MINNLWDGAGPVVRVFASGIAAASAVGARDITDPRLPQFRDSFGCVNASWRKGSSAPPPPEGRRGGGCRVTRPTRPLPSRVRSPSPCAQFHRVRPLGVLISRTKELTSRLLLRPRNYSTTFVRPEQSRARVRLFRLFAVR
ncbi:hypothetical protein GWI33_005570 [Rhynchophorus ferrugineus]|uniref:Uncharacterized protein n=1 Tax=Rhynchophorus ferrugineus TaxID=354439 RepID=A0A834ILG4_RHYFE|nr:hypothetical protein GWI33_005570 [Rhynchophorus ferrugineus]